MLKSLLWETRSSWPDLTSVIDHYVNGSALFRIYHVISDFANRLSLFRPRWKLEKFPTLSSTTVEKIKSKVGGIIISFLELIKQRYETWVISGCLCTMMQLCYPKIDSLASLTRYTTNWDIPNIKLLTVKPEIIKTRLNYQPRRTQTWKSKE